MKFFALTDGLRIIFIVFHETNTSMSTYWKEINLQKRLTIMWWSACLWSACWQGLIDIVLTLDSFQADTRWDAEEEEEETIYARRLFFARAHGKCQVFPQWNKRNDVGFFPFWPNRIDRSAFSSWTYEHLLSTATIEKKDLSLIGYLTSLICLCLVLCSFIIRIPLHFYGKNRRSTDDECSSTEEEASEPSTTPSAENSTSDFWKSKGAESLSGR